MTFTLRTTITIPVEVLVFVKVDGSYEVSLARMPSPPSINAGLQRDKDVAAAVQAAIAERVGSR